MTREDAIAFLEAMVVETHDTIQLDKEKWEEFKVVAVEALLGEGVDPKYQSAFEQIDAIVSATKG